MKKKEKGFTLVELAIVIAIIALLMGAIMMGVKGAKDSANISACAQDIKTLYSASGLWLSQGYTNYAKLSLEKLKDAELIPLGLKENNWDGVYLIGPAAGDITRVKIRVSKVPDKAGAALENIYGKSAHSVKFDRTTHEFTVEF